MIDTQNYGFLNERRPDHHRQPNAVEIAPARFLLAIFKEMQGHEIRQAFLEIFQREPVLCRIIGNAVETHRGIEAMTDEGADPAEKLRTIEYVTRRNGEIFDRMLAQKAQGPPADRPIEDDEDENIFEK